MRINFSLDIFKESLCSYAYSNEFVTMLVSMVFEDLLIY